MATIAELTRELELIEKMLKLANQRAETSVDSLTKEISIAAQKVEECLADAELSSSPKCVELLKDMQDSIELSALKQARKFNDIAVGIQLSREPE